MDEKSLFILAKAGDLTAMDELLQWVKNYSFKIAFYVLFMKDEAEEIAQECTWRFYKSFERLNPRGSLRGWVRKVSVNLSVDYVRREKKKVPLEENIVRENVNNEKVSLVGKCLGKLPPMQRTVITLFYIEGIHLKEISELLGIAPGTVKTHLFRGRNKLRDCLKEGGLL